MKVALCWLRACIALRPAGRWVRRRLKVTLSRLGGTEPSLPIIEPYVNCRIEQVAPSESWLLSPLQVLHDRGPCPDRRPSRACGEDRETLCPRPYRRYYPALGCGD